jgi:hypothetical protein
MCRPNSFHFGNVPSGPWLDAALRALEQSEKLVPQAVVVKATVSLVDEAVSQPGFIEQSGPRNHRLCLSPAIAGRPDCVGPLAELDRALCLLCCLPRFDFLGHCIFSFSAPLLAGHQEASGACSPGQGLLFWRGRKTWLYRLIFRRNLNPEGLAQAAKQKPAVPPARRGRPQLAVPAKTKGARKGM